MQSPIVLMSGVVFPFLVSDHDAPAEPSLEDRRATSLLDQVVPVGKIYNRKVIRHSYYSCA